MKFFNTLSKREKILIYVLSLLLLVFLYVNFIRDSLIEKLSEDLTTHVSMEDYDLLVEKYDKEEAKSKEFSKFIEDLEEEKGSFGKNLDLDQLSQEGKFNISSFNISNVCMDNDEQIKAFYIDKTLLITDSLDKIKDFVSFIKSNDKLFIQDLNLNRLNENDFEATIRVREYTLNEVPYTGIAYSHKEKGAQDLADNDKTLLNILYGEEKLEPAEGKVAGSKGGKRPTKVKSAKKEEEPIEEEEIKDFEVNENPEGETEELEETEEIKEINYDFINKNNEAHNKDLYFSNLTYYFDNDFLDVNKEKLEKSSNINTLSPEVKDGILEFKFNKRLPFIDYDVKIDPADGLIFELEGSRDLRGKLYLIDDSMALYIIDFVKEVDGEELIRVDLDKKYKYPLSFQSLIMDENTWEDVVFRNLVTYEY